MVGKGDRARTPEDEREKKRKRKKRKKNLKKEERELRGTRCNDNAFCRMTDSFHIAGGCCRCVGVRGEVRPRTRFLYQPH